MVLVVNPVINFVIYEGLKKYFLKRGFSMNALQLFLISSVGKFAATIVTYPILTIKVQLQANKQVTDASVITQIVEIVKSNGFVALYNGILPKLVQTILYSGFLMITYEKLRKLIKFMLFYYAKRSNLIKN